MSNTYPASGIACIQGIYSNTRLGGFPGGGDGALFMCIPGNDYHAIRSFDSCSNTNTIHFFGTTWGGGAGNLGTSSGAVNLDGACGVTLGPWNGPIMVVSRANCSVGINTGTTSPNTHNGRGLVVNGRGADTRGIIELWDSNGGGGKSVLQQVSGDTYLGQLARGTGSGHLYFLTGGSGSSATISMMVSCAGSVGIGTTDFSGVSFGNPSIHVVGNRATLGLTSSGGLSTIALVAGNCGQTGLHINHGNDGKTAFYSYTLGGEALTLLGNGRLGIGATEPLARIHVEQSTSGEVARFRANAAGCADLVLVNNVQTWGLRVDNSASNALHIRNFQNTTNIMTFATGGNVGIGTSSPQSALHVAGELAGAPSGVGVHIGVDAGGYAGIQLTGGTSQGAYIDFSCSGTDAPGRIIYDHTSNSLDFTVCAASRMTIVCNGSVGIGTITPSYRLHVNGTFYAAGSSIKYKESICNYNTDSCLFMCLKPVTYQYKDEFKHLGKELKSETQIGLIAEDVAESYPELAILVNEEDNKVVRNVDYEKLSIILLSELQKLRKEVDELKQ